MYWTFRYCDQKYLLSYSHELNYTRHCPWFWSNRTRNLSKRKEYYFNPYPRDNIIIFTPQWLYNISYNISTPPSNICFRTSHKSYNNCFIRFKFSAHAYVKYNIFEPLIKKNISVLIHNLQRSLDPTPLNVPGHAPAWDLRELIKWIPVRFNGNIQIKYICIYIFFYGWIFITDNEILKAHIVARS